MWKWQKIKKLEYEDVFKDLNKGKIRYLLIGGAAVILYGVPRVTADVDLMLSMTKENILKFVKIMNKLGYKPKVPVDPKEFADPEKRKEWEETKNMIVFSFQHPDDPLMVIDIMINSPVDFDEAYNKREIIHKWGTEISVIPKEDLMKLKEIAGRDQDLSDIALLKRSQELKDEEFKKT